VIRILKKVITWAIVIFIVFYLVTQPTSSANLLHGWYKDIHSIGSSLAKFVTSL
jgi:hypothetical protein